MGTAMDITDDALSITNGVLEQKALLKVQLSVNKNETIHKANTFKKYLRHEMAGYFNPMAGGLG